MTKKPTKPRERPPDESQIALSVVEKAIGGKLVDTQSKKIVTVRKRTSALEVPK